MSKIANISGQISVRPCRVGMVCEPNTASVVSAANLASGVWGGGYFPMLLADDDDKAQRIARSLGVDVLYAVDDSPGSRAMAAQPGYAIRDLGLGSPFARSEWDQVRLLGIDWLIDHAVDIDLVRPTWTDTDPLSGLFSVWFGGLPDGDARGDVATVSSAFLRHARRWPLDPKAQLPELIGVETLLGLTCHEIRQEIDVERAAFVVMNPQSADDLRAFWNLRAAGQDVFPWPVGHEERVMTAARAWLESALTGDRLGASHSGAGERLGPHMRVIIPPATVVPEALSALLEEKGVISSAGHGDLPRSWHGTHPFVTEFRRNFSISFDARRLSLAIPFPSRMPSGARGTRAVGIIAAQVDFQREEGLGPTRTFAAPNLRVIASSLTPRNTPELFQTSALGGGRVVGVNAAQEEVELSTISVEAIFRSILGSGSGWSCAQGDNGRFAAQLAERLGGAGAWLGNQPAIGAVLLKAASNPDGLPIPALIQAAKRKQGLWPAPLSRTREKYPTDVVYELLRRKLLLPVHKVKCPTCTVEYAVRPEDLAVDLTCEVCSEQFPLGFALGLAGPKTPWGFRLAGTVPPIASAKSCRSWQRSQRFRPHTSGSHPRLCRTFLGLKSTALPCVARSISR
ncbi:hypothetical protein ACFQY4_35380 [Catellatospora bangladeshensis]|uniref:hypothetical protein n=1 Tax=Catellatospora bangladeshensis TaxID=310355 RepID=UPI003610063B